MLSKKKQALYWEKNPCETKASLANNFLNKIGGKKENWVKKLTRKKEKK